MFRKLIEAAAQRCECAQRHSSVPFLPVHFTLRAFYLHRGELRGVEKRVAEGWVQGGKGTRYLRCIHRHAHTDKANNIRCALESLSPPPGPGRACGEGNEGCPAIANVDFVFNNEKQRLQCVESG